MDISVKNLHKAVAIREQIDALQKRLATILSTAAPKRQKRTGALSPAARKKPSQAMKARWAARKNPAGKKVAAAIRKRALTPAGRRKLSQTMKARWAARRGYGISDTHPPPKR